MLRNPLYKPRIIAELGSCHMGSLERILTVIDSLEGTGIDLKLQLFPDKAPYTPTNIYLPQDMFTKAFFYARGKGVNLSASVFDKESFEFLLEHRPTFIKFAYSKKEQVEWVEETLSNKIEAIVSCDIMTDSKVPKEATKLYCIPEYPVRYEVNFDELFPRFFGFSDHTLGFRQTQKALETGAKLIEKHVRIGLNDETCPDAFFAVKVFDLLNNQEMRKFRFHESISS